MPKRGRNGEDEPSRSNRQRAEADDVDAPSSPGSAANHRDAPSSPGVDRDEAEELMAEEDRMREADVLPEQEEEEDGEDLFGDNLMRDYESRPEEDVYDPAGIDEEDYEPIAADARAAVEEQLEQRDKQKRARSGGRGRRLPRALMSSDDDPSSDGGLLNPSSQDDALGSQQDGPSTLGYEFSEADPSVPDVDLTNVKGSLHEFIALDPVRKKIAREFYKFLTTHRDPRDPAGRNYYMRRIDEMAVGNEKSLRVSYVHLSRTFSVLAMYLADAPAQMLTIFNEVALKLVLEEYPKFGQIQSEVFVRITDVPVTDTIRDIRQVHLNALIKVPGVVTRRTGVFPQLTLAKFDCVKCGFTIGPIAANAAAGSGEIKVSLCPECQSRGPFNLNAEETVYRNYQKITLQEPPGSIPPGRLPRSKEVILLADLIDTARPGEEIEVTGVYKHSYNIGLNVKQGFPVFSTVLEANHVQKRSDGIEAYKITEQDKEDILTLSQDPKLRDKVMRSIAPSIYGHNDIKLGLALCLFGGVQKSVNEGKHRIRGDINVLLLGDPGTAKSQFLKFVEKTASRAVFTTGKGSTAVGLTASVHKDAITGEWTLEGGALVLADNGVCLIDEFDKMNDADRTSIHEAMEQQSISISKAGIITTLQARCAVIAAANPVKGNYDPALTFKENVELSDPILSRFDILHVVRDTPDPEADEKLALFVTASHIKSHPHFAESDLYSEADLAQFDLAKEPAISQNLLRKYIMYAKQHVSPKLQSINKDKIMRVYAEMRRESGSGLPISVRHIESIIRMSEAHARMHLRESVRDEDVNVAISVMVNSFISTQKYAVRVQLEKSFSKYIVKDSDQIQLLMHLLQELVKEQAAYERYMHGAMRSDELTVEMDDLRTKANALDIYDLEPLFVSPQFKAANYKLDRENATITKSFS